MNAFIVLILAVSIIFSLTFVLGLMKREKRIWIPSVIFLVISILGIAALFTLNV